jgi:hypothetical protein
MKSKAVSKIPALKLFLNKIKPMKTWRTVSSSAAPCFFVPGDPKLLSKKNAAYEFFTTILVFFCKFKQGMVAFGVNI